MMKLQLIKEYGRINFLFQNVQEHQLLLQLNRFRSLKT